MQKSLILEKQQPAINTVASTTVIGELGVVQFTGGVYLGVINVISVINLSVAF